MRRLFTEWTKTVTTKKPPSKDCGFLVYDFERPLRYVHLAPEHKAAAVNWIG